MHDWKVHDCDKRSRLSLNNQGLILALITLHTKPLKINFTFCAGIRKDIFSPPVRIRKSPLGSQNNKSASKQTWISVLHFVKSWRYTCIF